MAKWPVDGESRETAYAFVYRMLRHAVLDGTFQEGTRLFQAELGERLDVSTTPVREALQKLASEGLVDMGAGRGAVVHTLSGSEWSEIVLMRRLMEPVALRRAGERIDTRLLAEAEQIYRQMDEETDIVAWLDLNRRFHGIHYEAAESPRMTGVLMALLDATTQYLARAMAKRPAIVPQAQSEHAAIIEGLRCRDGDTLEEIAVRHLETALPVERQVIPHPERQTIPHPVS